MTLVLSDSEIARVLVITAHPDDVDFGAAGTIAQFTRAGIDVVYCICTDGQAGGFEDSVPRSEIGAIRRAEQRSAAARVGVHDVRFLGRVDGELEPDLSLVREITRVIREVRPDRLLTQSPERDWTFLARSHPDHLAAGEAAVRAVYPAARNPYAFPELADAGLKPWTVREVWLSGHPTTNHVVDITETFEQKMDALYAHQSQHPAPGELEPRLRDAFGRVATSAGLPAGHLAEGYFVISTG